MKIFSYAIQGGAVTQLLNRSCIIVCKTTHISNYCIKIVGAVYPCIKFAQYKSSIKFAPRKYE